jgi:hypothetical protein
MPFPVALRYSADFLHFGSGFDPGPIAPRDLLCCFLQPFQTVEQVFEKELVISTLWASQCTLYCLPREFDLLHIPVSS